jgi:hypothetical protein
MTKKTNPVEVFPLLITQLKNFQFINSGGCGVVAAHVAKRLQHIVPTRIVVFNRASIDIDKIRSKLTNTNSSLEWSYHGMAWGHVMVEFDYDGMTYLFDSHNIYPTTQTIHFGGMMLTKSGYVTIDEIVAIASRPTTWNWMFSRSQIPAMKKRIHRFFEKHLFIEV